MLPKESVRVLTPYEPKAFNGKIKLDANEATIPVLEGLTNNLPNALERYPDSFATRLREEASSYYGVNVNQIIAGNGSSEMIELTLKTYIDQGDSVCGMDPSFQMYKVFSSIYGAPYFPLSLDNTFEIDSQTIIHSVNQQNAKVVFLCTPNNPTGKVLTQRTIIDVLENTNALVIVDEAYIEFYDEKASMREFINTYDNLIILRTLSKALGLAGLRLGFLIANETIIETLNKVKAPYNLNAITQTIGCNALKKMAEARPYLENVKAQRATLFQALKALDLEVVPSEANFILFKSDVANINVRLEEKGILIRAFRDRLRGFYRVSIGTEEENTIFINTLKEVLHDARRND